MGEAGVGRVGVDEEQLDTAAQRSTNTLRVGVLGAARITHGALLRPSAARDDVVVAAIAARSSSRAHELAGKHDIARVHASYRELLEDPDIDAVYVPLPNGLHGRWTERALAAGKHVLCEKPFAANGDEARRVAEASLASGMVVMEAFHHRYHPLAMRAREIVDSGELGTIQRVEAAFCVPCYRRSDIRFDPALAGGAMMDTGCYAVHLARLLGRCDVDGEPTVVSAEAKLRTPTVDRAMAAQLEFPGGAAARVRCSLWSAELLRSSARVIGEHGEMRVFNPIAPQLFGRISVRVGAARRVEHFTRRPTYAYQLDAFVGAVRNGGEVLTGPDDAVATMRVVDEIYRAAALPVREPSQ